MGTSYNITLIETINCADSQGAVIGTHKNVTLTETVHCIDNKSSLIGTHKNFTLTETVDCADSFSFPSSGIISLDTVTSTLPTVLIGNADFTGYVQRIELWLKATEGVGRFQIGFFNQNQALESISPNASVKIYNKQYPMMKGYIDVPESSIIEDYQDKAISQFSVSGRDLAQNLQNLVIGKVYLPMNADQLIQDTFATAGSTLGFISPSSTQVYYQPKGKYLLDTVRDVLELIDYDGFVQTNAIFRMFPHDGSNLQPSSGLTLKSIQNDASSNVIKLVDRVKGDTTDLKNYIITLISSTDNDIFTELNAADWQASTSLGSTSGTAGDYTDFSPVSPSAGVAAIKLPTGNFICGGKLIFPLYGISKLDYSALTSPVNITFDVYGADMSLGGSFIWYFILTDDQGNSIAWRPTGGLGKSATWTNLSFPCGPTEIIHSQPPDVTWDAWNYFNGSSSFNWRIVSVEFAGAFSSSPNSTYVLIDNLQIPNVQPVAVAYWGNMGDSYPSNYGKRQLLVTKGDFGTFKEALDYSKSIYRKRKDPLEKLTLWIKGDAAFVSGQGWMTLPGYKVNVTIDQWGLSNVSYRFMEIHHVIDRASPELGWNHRIELSLVLAAAKLQTQVWSYGQTQGAASVDRALRDRLTSLEVKARAANNWYNALP